MLKDDLFKETFHCPHEPCITLQFFKFKLIDKCVRLVGINIYLRYRPRRLSEMNTCWCQCHSLQACHYKVGCVLYQKCATSVRALGVCIWYICDLLRTLTISVQEAHVLTNEFRIDLRKCQHWQVLCLVT